ncbi:MAG: FG-GAP repeat domain-containing protein [Ardenticatenaceae bacterium]
MTSLLRRHLASILKSRRFVSNFFLGQRWLRAFSPLVIAFTLMILYFWPLTPAAPAHADLADEFVFVGIDTKFTRSVAWGDMDGDGDLDLAIGNYGDQESNRVYRNEGNGAFALAWESEMITNTKSTTSVAWGDMDGDGDLDLAVGNEGQRNEVYENNGLNDDGDLNLIHAWSSDMSQSTHSVAWGDMDGDGDLDLAVGNYGQANEVYTNTGLILADKSAWTSTNVYSTTSVAWGDMDGDGDLDLAVGNLNEVNQVYTNTGSTLGSTPTWSAMTPMSTTSVAWGDMDGDGKLDLAVGNDGPENQVYTNISTILGNTPAWESMNERNNTRSVAWGDWDADGDMDLAVGNYRGQASQVYRNDGTTLAQQPWELESSDEQATSSVAWGDIDSDGDLDLALGNDGQSNQVYLNDAPILRNTPVWTPPDSEPSTHSVAWGDMDGDGNLDLAVGNWGEANQVYTNTGTILGNTPAWTSTDTIATRSTSVAWGDMDGDGDLDLAIGNTNHVNQVYRNKNGMLEETPVWTSTESYTTTSIAWGDMNGDGYLDLAVGNDGQVNQVYSNTGRILAPTPAWSSTGPISTTRSVAWGDMDGDGDLDLAIGNYQQVNQVYANEGGILGDQPIWESNGEQTTLSVAWGDVDGDDDLDLAVGNQAQVNQVYLNEGGILQTQHAWQSSDSKATSSVAWGDMDGDGDLDLAVGNYADVNQVYRNEGRTLGSQPIWQYTGTLSKTLSVAWGDMDRDGDLDLAAGSDANINLVFENPRQGNTASSNMAPYLTVAPPDGAGYANFYASSKILSDTTIPISYTLFHTQANSLEQLAVFYSLDGGGRWEPAISTSDTITTNLTTSPDGVSHLFAWDTFASGFFGQSDNVVLRFVAHSQANRGITSTYQYTNRVAGPYLWPASSATTFPFRVRGTQVQVYTDTIALGNELADALVYRLPARQLIGAEAMGSGNKPFVTDQKGYLQGQGELNINDKLIALYPIAATDSYTLYHTSATPTLTGLDAYTVTTSGVQQLIVSRDNPLILFNLDVSLEWDARNDNAYLALLESNLQRTSQLLYDWTNGQVALGNIRVFHDKENWLDSHIIIPATNNLRPSAALGGIVDEPQGDEIIVKNKIKTINYAYLPGQVRMAVVWNRFGNSSGEVGVDWPRTLAHELGHYLLYLPDNYLGLSENDLLIQVDCQGSAMTDPYRENYSEFLIEEQWNDEIRQENCGKTLADETTGRADWQTITKFYKVLKGPENKNKLNAGPSNFPLQVTQVEFVAPDGPIKTLPDPFFYITNESDQPLALPFGQAQGYLLKNQDTPDPTDDVVVAVGSPRVDLLQARGAELGDRLCLFDYSHTSRRMRCLDDISEGSSNLKLYEDNFSADQPEYAWQPEITVDSVTSRTLAITVTQAISVGDLYVQILPAARPTTTQPIYSPFEKMIRVSNSDTFTQIISLNDPVANGFVRIWVTSDTLSNESNDHFLREDISEFFISGNWAYPGDKYDWTPPSRRYGWGISHRHAWQAPLATNDGQVTIFELDRENILGGKRKEAALHSLSAPPNLPSWLTLVGQAYRFSSKETFVGTIMFDYLQRTVPEGQEEGLSIYYLPNDGDSWQRLPTELDPHHNLASAKMPEQGEGIYGLISTIEMPAFEPGWNNFGYPLVQTQTVTTALGSISGSYTSLYHYEASSELWRLYDQTVVREHSEFSGLVNDLTSLKFGQSYYISATKPITLYLGIPATGNRQPMDVAGLELPPATFYGWVKATHSFTPTDRMTVTAWVGDTLCGQSNIKSWQAPERLVYKLQVKNNRDCRVENTEILFKVEGEDISWDMENSPQWNNSQAQFHELTSNDPTAVTLTSVTAPATSVAPNALLAGGLLLLTLMGGLLYRRRRE